MSTQALNSLNLYRGQNQDTIFKLLQFQKSSVVNELMFELEASDVYDLSVKLSLMI